MEIATFMKISNTHKRFANRLDDQTSLEYPERFLGPNWKNVLNFWLYLDTLSGEKLNLIDILYISLDDLGTLMRFSWKAAKGTIGYEYTDAAWAASAIASVYATLELIASHKLETLNFLPLFLTP